jgi:hypothetical protein
MWRILVHAVLWLSLAGCSSPLPLPTNTGLPSEAETFFVLGVTPPNYRVVVRAGTVTDRGFNIADFQPVKANSAPTNGYVVWKGEKGESMAITHIIRQDAHGKSVGRPFVPCDKHKTMVFESPGGKVIYLGHVKYQVDGDRLMVVYEKDFEAAKSYIDKAYPSLREQVTDGRYALLPTTEPCSYTLFVPIYVPAR